MQRKMIRGIISIILIGILFISIFSAFAPKANAQTVDWWSMFKHDSAHTGSSTSTAPQTNTVIWSFTAAGGVKSSAAVINGVVYVG